ncbi:MAG: hypothetical protein AAF340_14620 [Pseudomonadota bacterium]
MPHSSDQSEHSKHHMNCCGLSYERLEDHPFDAFEKNVLTLARLFFLSFHLPKRQAWVSAFQFGEDRFGKSSGAAVAKGVMEIVNAMRSTRTSGFGYCDAFGAECSASLTREERYLISTLHHMRNQNPTAAAMNAMLLCEGADTTAYMARIDQLIALTSDAIQPSEVSV